MKELSQAELNDVEGGVFVGAAIYGAALWASSQVDSPWNSGLSDMWGGWGQSFTSIP